MQVLTSNVKVWEEVVTIPTYEIGEAEKNPIFLDKRVYQGSSGKVYPYPTIETISDTKVDKTYKAVYLENDYLKVMILPELGGRIQRAYDKTIDYDFVYYNQVIKPALVGLTGPWISGGIEFNWPQHHRPTTFLPVDYKLISNEDGSKSVIVHDVDQMYGTKGSAMFTLYPECAYIEIKGQLYNRTPMPQTFLWWANPAVAVNDYTQSIFPPDVHAVMDHGKRDVSRFPIATGIYYKMDYSEGVDISRYKNIPVPTSYMAEKSNYDFVGGYDYQKEAGILHVADHHMSPGKKQWTWGCGDFGQAWDRNLTDEDGPYIELMTGMFTDNQPDFTWLKPFEEKTFTQYFMPYKKVAQVKNATKDVVMNMEVVEDGLLHLCVYTSSPKTIEIQIKNLERVIFSKRVDTSPVDIYEEVIACDYKVLTDLAMEIYEGGQLMTSYRPEKEDIQQLPEPAQAVGQPSTIPTLEELFLAGQHIEQYRHATYSPDPYYLEGLKRDPEDSRLNNAYGLLCLRRGNFSQAKVHFEKAIKRLTRRNPNPYDSEAYYNLGLVNMYLGDLDQAFEAFFKATWANEQQEMSYYYLAAIDAQKGNYSHSLEMVNKGLIKNWHNIKARGLKAYILRKLGRVEEASQWINDSLQIDAFDFLSGIEAQYLMDEDNETYDLMRGFSGNHLMIARDYAEFGAFEEAIEVLDACKESDPLMAYYKAYYYSKLGNETLAEAQVAIGEEASPDYCFPNKLEDLIVLDTIIRKYSTLMAPYYLGNLLYDKHQHERAIKLWEITADKKPEFTIPHRNLSLAYYNKMDDKEKAKASMEKAYELNPQDPRVFLELDQLYKKLDMSFQERLARYEEKLDVVKERDDLYIEYITLLNMCGRYEEAYNKTMNHIFHPWEGGEGKITSQYVISLLHMAQAGIKASDLAKAEDLLKKALYYPHNLGEGKLEGTTDNHIYYHLGLIQELKGDTEEAMAYYELATLGTDEPAGMMYYNDQPADMIMYQGLAKLKLGKVSEAKSRFYRLIDYGEQHLFDQVKIEYFAVSLPDFLIFDDDYSLKNKAHCYYLIALGNWGLGNVEKARNYLEKTMEVEASHMMGHLYSKSFSE